MILRVLVVAAVLGLFLIGGLTALLIPNRLQDWAVRSYRKERLADRLDPFRRYVESDFYPLVLRVIGVASLGAFVLGLLLVLGVVRG
jgi:hypothetical protein